ncbi:hypothetical protein [Arthrobacter bambusae]|uniref:Uncharacterized protein n=1 Tax=Arthrobacter bambusae TaxID=1338426 RepID=A0AAW8D775_9MICC|nr:hypothetical protein [Arthrobacter bambusae]MDP9904766.1 hypothetical protein [Arthrobacter bambusae]MDQ0129582.1 hypothetical protein [Arthrobacter bambusae]MDQ0180805.1 hypothetical protein [Arthrobacter bambusae]
MAYENNQGAGRGRKTLPVYGEYTGPAADEPPVDADWHEGDRAWFTGPGWDETAREFFDTRAQRVRDELSGRREAARKAINDRKDLSERDELTLLRRNIQAAGKQYMESLRKSDILVPGFNDNERTEKLSAMHRVYGQMMVTSAMRPLQEGVNTASVVRVMSTLSAMYLMSPTFRQVVKEKAAPVKAAIQERIDQKAQNAHDRAGNRADRHNRVLQARNEQRAALGKPPIKEARAEDYLPKRWQKRYDDLKFRERGHREMFTPRSAGMTEVALTENAFAALRQSGANSKEIMESYNSMISRLYRQCEEDGLTREEVAESSRVVLGERMREDPRVQVMVDGFSHGAQRLSPPHEERIAGTDQVQRVWRGDFQDCRGKPVDPTRYQDTPNGPRVAGAFTLRPQMGAEEHKDRMSEVMAMTMSKAASRGDMTAINETLAGYMLGAVARVRQVDGEGLPGVMPERLFQARTMQATMTADGLGEQQQRLQFSLAYMDALEAVNEAYPEFSQQWRVRYGETFRQFSAAVAADPVGAYNRWASASRDGLGQEPGRQTDEPVREPSVDLEWQP